jgi:3-methylfumaryl-CoA hydratase
MDDGALTAWIGKTETVDDVAAAGPVKRLAALLDHDGGVWREGEVPPLGHWLYFLPEARQSQIGEDGHPKRGGLLPPLENLPRRMWAGGEVEFLAPIRFSARLTRRSTVMGVAPKTGKSGAMVFVTLRHEIFCDGETAVVERQDIVYREAAVAMAPAVMGEAAGESEGARAIRADAVMLFRFSALTFNAHRIHYDRDYARGVEFYAGLVVHGPLVATLLMDHFLRAHPGRFVSRFRFRAQSPLLDSEPVIVNQAAEAGGAALWAAHPGGTVGMTARLETRGDSDA